VTKADLIEAIAAATGEPKTKVDLFVTAFCEVVMRAVAQGGSVRLVGFGNFDRVATKARTGRNPATGEPVEIPAGHRPRFRPGKTFKERI
jgi:DNA-binding protein HU-beta